MLLISQLYVMVCYVIIIMNNSCFLAECTVMCMYVSQIRHVSSLLELSLTHDNPSLWLAMHCNVSLARIMFWCWTVLRLGIETVRCEICLDPRSAAAAGGSSRKNILRNKTSKYSLPGLNCCE